MHVAGIYTVVDGNIDAKAKATIGDSHKLDTNDPMLLASLSTGELLSPAEIDSNASHNSRYQLCVPLKDTKGHIHAILISESVQFIALNPTNIALLALVANYAANLLSDSIVAPVLKPQQKALFISYLTRLKETNSDLVPTVHWSYSPTLTVKCKTSLNHLSIIAAERTSIGHVTQWTECLRWQYCCR